MSDSSDDDDFHALSAQTLAALQEFYDETSSAATEPADPLAVGAMEEDWVGLLVFSDSGLCFIFRGDAVKRHRGVF